MENRYGLISHLVLRIIASLKIKVLEVANEGKVLERGIKSGFDPETRGKSVLESIPIDTQKMQLIAVIVNEMAEIMLVYGRDIEISIMATQRPSVDIITGVINA
jgi:DNA segregation ATPase FtsK/SpoIIIE, S-DNA-T family